MHRSFIISCFVLASALIWTTPLLGQLPADSPSTQQFKIVTQVFLPHSKSPTSINETIFSNGLVYDFRFSQGKESADEVSIFDPINQKFVLVDYQRRKRLELDNLQLLRIVDGMKSDILENPPMKSVFIDGFEDDVDLLNNRITVNNGIVKYTAQGSRPRDDSMLPLFFQILDQFTLVGATQPEALPPFPRIRLNQEIRKLGILPDTIELHIGPNSLWNHEIAARSQHQLIENLSTTDLSKIKDAKLKWTQFEKVNLAEYRGIRTANSSNPSVKR